MVLPISYFLEHPFQNWTRHSGDLLGSVFLYVDYTVPAVRKELRRIVENNEKWRGQVCVLQVTDATANAIQLRALVDARDAGAAWDLRCEVREKLIQFLQETYPHGRFPGCNFRKDKTKRNWLAPIWKPQRKRAKIAWS